MTTDIPQLSEAKRALLNKRLRRDIPEASRRSISPRPSGTPIPLSFQQEQLWLAAQLAPDLPIDAEFITVSMTDALDVAALERSFNEMIRRHETMRTTFPAVDGEPVQVVHLPSAFTLPLVDLRELPHAEREAEAIRRATEEARRGFDLARGPLLRATLMRLDDAVYKLFLVLHHIVFDCLSWYAVFLPELAALYQAFCAGKPSPLPDLPIQYADYAHWQRRRLHGTGMDAGLAYWREQLAGSPAVLTLPTDRPRPPIQTFRGAMKSALLPKSLTEALQALSRREGVTFFMTLVAAFQTLLYRYSGQDDIPVGIDTGGRKQSELEPLIGFFLQTLVLRTNLTGNPTFQDLLQRVRAVTLAAYSHDDVPFGHLVKELQPKRDPGWHPLFQVVVRLGPRLAPLDCGWVANPADVDPGVSKFEMTLEVYETAEGAICRLEYKTDLFQARTMAQLLADFQALLESIVANPGQPINDLPIAAASETGWGEVPTVGDGARQHRRKAFVAPQTWLHGQLVQIWEELLGIRPIGISDDFFELGGTSLLAVRLMAMIESVLGQTLPLNALFTGATIEHLAQVITDGPDPELTSPLVHIQPDGGGHSTQDVRCTRTPLVALQTGGAKRPFFFLLGDWLGAAYYCLPLARELGLDQPCYALDTYKLDDLPVPPPVETIAAAHLEAVRAIQPDGPYLLGGYCNGGLIAYEMARQLHAQGQAVDMLVLMDPMPLSQDFPLRLRVLRGVVARGGALVRLSPEQQVVWFARLRGLLGQLYSYLVPHRRNNPGGARPPLASLILTADAVQIDYESKIEWAVLAYRPRHVYPGTITFFWPADEPWHSRWWRPVAEATEVEVHILPGKQDTWRTDHLHALAERLRLCLTKAYAVAGKELVSGGQATDVASQGQDPA